MATEQDDIQVGGLLGFPLPGYTPYTAPVSAVMDNSVLERTPIQFYVPGDLIKAFNDETGESQYGVIYLDPYGLYWPAYKNSAGTNFFPPNAQGVRPLNYLEGAYLSYAGNAGYNYPVPEGTPVLATADGKLYQAVTDPVNGAGYSFYYNSYIDHQNGWYSWYLYAPLTPAILAEISANGFAQVTKGQVIGQTIGDHLHFEVRLNGSDHQNVRDPYKMGLWQTNASKGVIFLMPLLDEEDPVGNPEVTDRKR
jgi:murein DD-endopeptidase MepM/ murein hydrolase activator NlpD